MLIMELSTGIVIDPVKALKAIPLIEEQVLFTCTLWKSA